MQTHNLIHSGDKVTTYIISSAKGPRCIHLSEANVEQILSKVADLCENVTDGNSVGSSLEELVHLSKSLRIPR